MSSTYFLPFYFSQKETEVLLASKKTFNENDGYMHNNPGQIVIVGGGGKGEKNAIREFNEETGNTVIPRNIVFNMTKKKFSVSYYHVKTAEEYDKLKKITLSKDALNKELDNLKWYSIKEAAYIFNREDANLPGSQAGKSIDALVKDYLTAIAGHNSNGNDYTIFRKFKGDVNIFLKQSFDSNNPAYNHVRRQIIKKSYVDWFAIAIQELEKYIEEKNKKPRKYVPPHLR